jgi:AraC family transcriptional regulator, activator of mtrCDE
MTEPVSNDALSAVASLLRARPELQECCRLSSHWATSHEAEPAGWAYFHIVTKGSCLIERQGGSQIRLEVGDLLLLPHGDAHIVRSRASRGGSYAPPVKIEYNNAVRIVSNTNDAETELICGRLRFEAAPDNLVVAALPDTLVLKLGGEGVLERMRFLMLAIRDELDGDRQGAAAIATDLASALFVMMLRAHFEDAAEAGGLLKLLASRPTARPVNAMLRNPARAWTLDELADEAHVSRATLVRAFRHAAGMAPLNFLAELRLSLARRQLARTGAKLAQVASDVGYKSESAFSRAFLRRFGITPGEARSPDPPG